MKEIEKIVQKFCYENGIEVNLSYDMPDELTYPQVSPKLYAEAEKAL